MFVDGAFWHGHPSRHRPGRSGEYWDEKIARNVERDRAADAALESRGWIVVRVWDFELAHDLEAVVERVTGALRERASDTKGWRSRFAGSESPAAPRNAPLDAQADSAAPQRRQFGENLRSARYGAGLSQAHLAERAGIGRTAVSAYERGEREPSLRTILRLARALEVPAGTLVRGL